MTANLWNVAVIAVQSLIDAPVWVKEQAVYTYQQVLALPTLETCPSGRATIPNISEKIVMPDYLDFLREQIELEPRGPEWTKVLKSRLFAMEPFVNKLLITATFYRLPDVATLLINPENGKVVHLEID